MSKRGSFHPSPRHLDKPERQLKAAACLFPAPSSLLFLVSCLLFCLSSLLALSEAAASMEKKEEETKHHISRSLVSFLSSSLSSIHQSFVSSAGTINTAHRLLRSAAEDETLMVNSASSAALFQKAPALKDEYSFLLLVVTSVSDAVISLCYFAIPLQIFYFQRSLTLAPRFKQVLALFELFTTCCGVTHLAAVWHPWTSPNLLMAGLKVGTALISLFTAVVMMQVIPEVLTLPAQAGRLEAELGIRIQKENRLKEANDMLMRFRSVTQHIRSRLDIKKICEATALELSSVLEEADGVAILLPDEEDQRYVCLAERLNKDRAFSWKKVEINMRSPLLEQVSLTKNKVISLLEEDLESMAIPRSVGSQAGTFSCRSGLLVGFSIDGRRHPGLVLICTKEQWWSLPQAEIEFLGDVVHQVEIVLSQTLQIEREKQRMQELSLQQKRNYELDRAKQMAEMETKLANEFLASMSHEIRTPMNAIIGFVTYMLQTAETDSDQREILETIAASSQTLLGILNDILDFSKVESGKLVLNNEEFAIRHSVENALHLMSSNADTKGLHLNYLLSEEVPEVVIGDPGRLQQVIMNLLSNAIKFTSRGEVYIVVTMESSVPASKKLTSSPRFSEYVARKANPPSDTSGSVEVYFHVVDSGIGIPADRLRLLFQRFKQLDSSLTRRYGGTGLGLAISAKLVEMYHGGIKVLSAEGEGSIFTFSMRFQTATTHVPTPTHRHGNVRLPSHLAVAVISSWPTTCQSLQQMIQSSGLMASSFSSCTAALKSSKEEGTAWGALVVDNDCLSYFSSSSPESEQAEAALEILAASCPVLLLVRPSLAPQQPPRAAKYLSHVLHKPCKKDTLLHHLQDLLSPETARGRRRPNVSTILTSPKSDFQDLSVLIVDDNAVNRKVIQRLLEPLGVKDVDQAENGYQAVFAVHKKRYDVVFMDVAMPELDGCSATRMIIAGTTVGSMDNNRDNDDDGEVDNRRRDEDDEDAVEEERRDDGPPWIIAMTASTMLEERRQCYEAGMNDFLPKPITPKELAAVLQTYVDRCRQ